MVTNGRSIRKSHGRYGGGIEKVYEFSARDNVRIQDLVADGYNILIVQNLYKSKGYKYGFSSFIWFDSNALEEFAPNKSEYATTWYMPRTTYGTGSLGNISFVDNLVMSITDDGVIARGNLSDSSIYLRFTAIKFKMAQ